MGRPRNWHLLLCFLPSSREPCLAGQVGVVHGFRPGAWCLAGERHALPGGCGGSWDALAMGRPPRERRAEAPALASCPPLRVLPSLSVHSRLFWLGHGWGPFLGIEELIRTRRFVPERKSTERLPDAWLWFWSFVVWSAQGVTLWDSPHRCIRLLPVRALAPWSVSSPPALF